MGQTRRIDYWKPTPPAFGLIPHGIAWTALLLAWGWALVELALRRAI